MKKFFTVTLAAATAAALGTTGFAGEELFTKGPVTIEVTGEYKATSEADVVVSVDVKWDAMEFTYIGADSKKWDPTEHEYETESEGWVDETSTITLVNHSNSAIEAAFAFASEDSMNIAGKFTDAEGEALTDNKLTLATAVGTTVASAPTETAEFGIDSDSSDGLTESDESTEIGRITVTLTAVSTPEE